MKILTLTIMMVGFSVLFGQGWNMVGQNISENETLHIKTVLDSNNVPYVAYYGNDGISLIIKKFIDGEWTLVGVDQTLAINQRLNPNLVISGTIPYIAYYNRISQCYQIRKIVNGEWEMVGSPTDLPYLSSYLDISNDGIPYVVYRDQANQLNVKKFISGAWQTVGNANFETSYGSKIILVISDNIPYVGYIRDASSRISVAKLINGVWETIGTPNFSSGLVDRGSFSLSVSENGTPYVAYFDQNYNALTVMGHINGLWSIIGSPGFSVSSAVYISMDIANDETIYVAYRDNYNNDKISVMSFAGQDWQFVGSPGFSSGQAALISMLVDSANIPYVGYHNSGTNIGPVVQRFTGILFEGNPRNGYLPLTVNFTGQASEEFVNWNWDFGDGNTSTLQNPQHTYLQAGSYSITLTATNQAGIMDSLTKVHYITAVEVTPMPPTDFSIAINGRHVVLSWSQVLTNVVGSPINVEGYVVYHSPNPNDNFYYLGFTESTTFTHSRVTQFEQKHFYKVTTFVGNPSRLAGLVARNPQIKLGQLDQLLADQK